jgi:hypothetical protein
MLLQLAKDLLAQGIRDLRVDARILDVPHSIGFSGRRRSLDCQRRLPRYFPCAPSSQLRNLSENNLNNIGNLKIYH